MESPDPESMQMTPDEAFSQVLTFKGQLLNGFSAQRELVAQAMGHRLLSGCARMEARNPGAYAGAFYDIALVVWLCTLPDDDLDQPLADPDTARKQVLAWVRDEAVSFGSPAFNEAMTIHASIMTAIFVSRFEVAEKKTGSTTSKPAPPQRKSPTGARRST